MKHLLLPLLMLASMANLQAQVDTSLRTSNAKEIDLYNQIMEYRLKKRLDSIDLSPSLCKVAQTHVRDLNTYPPSGRCNPHSWSKNGPWESCCYTPDHRNAECMWSKPRELTTYEGDGYEIVYWCSDSTFTAKEALDSWKESSGHNPVIINSGTWKTHPWKAIGVAAEGNYAVVWFGEEIDNACMER